MILGAPETQMDMRFMMKQAQQMQAKLQEAQQSLRAEGTAGGAVKITLNGAKELVGVSISRDAIDAMDPDDPSMLEDLIMAAFKDASAKADAAMSKVTGGMAAGLGIPGLKL
jgi:DNA-binding YbaB/EbfC family protein